MGPFDRLTKLIFCILQLKFALLLVQPGISDAVPQLKARPYGNAEVQSDELVDVVGVLVAKGLHSVGLKSKSTQIVDQFT